MIVWSSAESSSFGYREDGMGEIYAYVPFNEENKTQLSQVPPYSKQNPDYGFSVGRGAFRFEPGRWHTVAERVRLNVPEQADGTCLIFTLNTSTALAPGACRPRQRSAARGSEARLYANIRGSSSPPGEIELWFDGESVIRVGGLRLRENPRIAVRGLHMQTFYGGAFISLPSGDECGVMLSYLAKRGTGWDSLILTDMLMLLHIGHTAEWAPSQDQRAWFGDLSAAILRENT
jgi:hypothetical protein